MPDVPGYRQGIISSVRSLVRKGDRLAVGDLVAQSVNYIKTWSVMDALPGPSTFFDTFLGVVLEPPTTGGEAADTPALVQTQGQCYYPLDKPAAAYAPVGTFVTAVGDQVVALDTTANESLKIGKVCVPVAQGEAWVLFELRSKVMS